MIAIHFSNFLFCYFLATIGQDSHLGQQLKYKTLYPTPLEIISLLFVYKNSFMQPLQLVSIGAIMTGGTTRPVNIIALDENRHPRKYVMKVFTEKIYLKTFLLQKKSYVLN